MQLLEMTLPADFATLRQQKGASLTFTTLEILEDIERSPDSILIRCEQSLYARQPASSCWLHAVRWRSSVADARHKMSGGGPRRPTWSELRPTSS